MALLVVAELQNTSFFFKGSMSDPSKGSYPDRVLNQETTELFQEETSLNPAIHDVELLPWHVLQCLMCFFLSPQVTLPTAQVPRASAIPLPPAAAATGAAPAPIPPDKQATEALPHNLYPIQLSSVTFLAEGESVGNKFSLRGRLQRQH